MRFRGAGLPDSKNEQIGSIRDYKVVARLLAMRWPDLLCKCSL